MKTEHTARLIALLLTICCLLGMAVPTMAEGGIAISPLDDTEGYLFQYWLDEPNVSFYLPLTARAELVMYVDDVKVVSMQSQEMPDYEFIFFAFPFEEMKTPIEKMTEEEIGEVLAKISNLPEKVTYELADEFLPGVSVVRAWEPREDVEIYAEHLLALKDGWLFNMMVRRFDGVTTIDQPAIEFQEDALRYALGEQPMQSSYTLPDSDIRLTLPEPLHFFVSKAEPDYHRLVLADPRTGIVVSSLTFTAVRDPAYEGKTVETLDKEALEQLMRMETLGGYDEDSVEMVKDETGTPMLSFASSFSTVAGSQHLLAMRDGWALLLTSTPTQNMYTDWMRGLQPSLMHSLLSGEPMAEVDPPHIPLMGGVSSNKRMACIPMETMALIAKVPEGYVVDVVVDSEKSKEVALYHKEDESKFYYLNVKYMGSETDETLETLLDEAQRETLGQDAAALLNTPEREASYSYASESIFGIPGIFVENVHVAEYIAVADGFFINIMFSSPEPITEAEKDSLLEIFTLVAAE